MSEKENFGMTPDGYGADIPVALSEEQVHAVYALVDEAVAGELKRLRAEEGCIPSCKSGCCHCCRYHIMTDIAEARTLALFVRREFSAEQIKALRIRTHQWHEWDNSRPGRPAAVVAEQTDLSGYRQCCPLLVDGTCIAYSVRPIVCRVHYVSSPASFCEGVNNPDSIEEAPLVLKSIVEAAGLFSMVIRDQVEETGSRFSRSSLLLPQGLAIEMGWAFALSP